MSIRGINIEVPNKYSNYLAKIFDGIDIARYCWELVSEEILIPRKGDTPDTKFLANFADILTTVKFKELLALQKYLLYFFDIRAFESEDEIIELDTYEDFLKSKCQIYFCCYDVMWFDIYCKDESLTYKFLENSKKIDGAVAEITTDENDGRTRLGI